MSLTIRTIIEVIGFPKEHVDSTLQKMIAKIVENKDLGHIKHKFEEAIQIKEMFSAFVEMELKVKDIDKLIGFCFDYLPSSVEILDKEELSFKSKDFANSLNDMLANLHKYHVSLSTLYAENEVLKQKLNNVSQSAKK